MQTLPTGCMISGKSSFDAPFTWTGDDVASIVAVEALRLAGVVLAVAPVILAAAGIK
jgi:hypothetical protein